MKSDLIHFFRDLIHVYSPRAGGIQPPGDKVLMSTETSYRLSLLLLVSNHRRQLFLKNTLFHLLPKSIHVFAESLLSLAEEAYDNQEGDAVERQLIDIFVDGMTNDQLKMKILRDRPDTLQAAIGIATNEQNLRAKVNMSHTTKTVHEPMEVDHSRGQRFRPNRQANRVNSTVNNGSKRPVRSWHCNREGHVIRECRFRQQGGRPSMGHGRS